MREFKTKDFVVKFDDSKEVKDKVFEYLLNKFYLKYESFSGESIHQTDDPQIYAPEVLADIADKIIKFDVEWN